MLEFWCDVRRLWMTCNSNLYTQVALHGFGTANAASSSATLIRKYHDRVSRSLLAVSCLSTAAVLAGMGTAALGWEMQQKN